MWKGMTMEERYISKCLLGLAETKSLCRLSVLTTGQQAQHVCYFGAELLHSSSPTRVLSDIRGHPWEVILTKFYRKQTQPPISSPGDAHHLPYRGAARMLPAVEEMLLLHLLLH